MFPGGGQTGDPAKLEKEEAVDLGQSRNGVYSWTRQIGSEGIWVASLADR